LNLKVKLGWAQRDGFLTSYRSEGCRRLLTGLITTVQEMISKEKNARSAFAVLQHAAKCKTPTSCGKSRSSQKAKLQEVAPEPALCKHPLVSECAKH